MWTINTIESKRLRLLDDDIGNQTDAPDIFEQRAVADSLVRVIADELNSGNDGDFVIGLFGRYGQGKTKVVKFLIDNFDRRRISFNGKSAYTHCEVFQVSNYSVKDLEENFDFFLEGRRITTMALLSSAILLLLFFLVLKIVDALQIENRVQLTVLISLVGALLASLGSLIGSFRLLWRDFSRSLRVGQVRQFFSARLRSYWQGPKVLVIDDLDRATPDQQSALLQSLRRHRGTLGAVVVVAFNDEPLKAENTLGLFEAEEVFEKTFDLQARLGPMTASDAAEMSIFFLKRLCERNRSNANDARNITIDLFSSPLVVGDVARVLYLHGNASARFAKKMVNTIFFEADRLSLTSVHDVSALIRVHGLLTYFPNLESDLDFVGSALNAQSTDGLIKAIEARLGTALSPDRDRSIRRYLARTNHMRPSHGTWKRVLRIWRNVTERTDFAKEAVFSDELTRNWAMCDALLVATDADSDRQQIYRDLMENPFQHPRDRQLPRMPEFPTLADESPNDAQLLDFWKFLILRVYLYDFNRSSSLGDDFLIKVDQYERLKLPTAPPIVARSADSLWTSPAGIVEHHTRISFRDLRLEDSLRQSLSLVDFSRATDRELSPNTRRLPGLIVPIKRAWPSLDNASDATNSDPENHIDRLREVLALYRDTDEVMPNSIKEFFARRLLRNEEDFRLLIKLFHPSAGKFLPSGTLRDGLADQRFRDGFRHQLLERFLDINTEMAVWFVANYFIVTQDHDSELEERLGVLARERVHGMTSESSRLAQDAFAAAPYSQYFSDLGVRI